MPRLTKAQEEEWQVGAGGWRDAIGGDEEDPWGQAVVAVADELIAARCVVEAARPIAAWFKRVAEQNGVTTVGTLSQQDIEAFVAALAAYDKSEEDKG